MKLLTIKDASRLTGKSENSIRDWFAKGYIRGTKDTVLKVYEDDLENYIANREKRGIYNPFGVELPGCDEAFKPLFTLKQGYIVFSKNMIMVGSSGTIWNVTHKHIYQRKATDTHGHIQIDIDGTLYYPHRLIAMLWCPNRLFKQNVHHIDGIPTNNKYTNLLWVTSIEHITLHKLLKSGKINEYNELIEKIRNDNQWQGDTLYPLIDQESSNSRWLDVYMTNYEGYCLLLQGFDINKLAEKKLIYMERSCPNENEKNVRSKNV